jgi:hypothetical protein
MKSKIIKKILTVNAVFACLFGVSLFFFFDTQLDDLLGKFLRVHPSFTGGEVAEDFVETTGDTDSLDFVRYTVFLPVINAKWVDNSEYWQLVLEYKNGSESLKDAELYIDFDNIAGGSTSPLSDDENFTFDKNHPWDYAVKVCDNEAKIFDPAKNFVCNAQFLSLEEGTQFKIRLPLRDEGLQRILGAKKTWHYVLAGGIPQFAGETSKPLEVAMKIQGKDSASEKEDDAFINQMKKMYAEAMDSDSDSDDIEENLTVYKQKIDENPEDFVSLANYGSNLAKKGGESSVIQAVMLVNEAYTYLDKAAQLSRGKDGEIEVLLNRASVSASVPEGVFGKSETGAKDFVRLASLSDDAEFKAYCWAMASECYKKCGKTTLSTIALQKARKVLN